MTRMTADAGGQPETTGGEQRESRRGHWGSKHPWRRWVKKNSVRAIMLVVFLGVPAAGVLYGLNHEQPVPAYSPDKCKPPTGAMITYTLTVLAKAQPVTVSVDERVALPAGDRQYAPGLLGDGTVAQVALARKCLFTGIAGTPAMVSSANGMLTFDARSGDRNLANFVAEEWSLDTHKNTLGFQFNPEQVCSEESIGEVWVTDWSWNDITLVVKTDSSPIKLTPAPSATAATAGMNSYSWHKPAPLPPKERGKNYNLPLCRQLLPVSFTVPITLADYAQFRVDRTVYYNDSGTISLSTLFGWLPDLVVTFTGLGMVIWNRPAIAGRTPLIRVALIAALGVLPAAIEIASGIQFSEQSRDMWEIGEIIVVYAVAYVLMCGMGRDWRAARIPTMVSALSIMGYLGAIAVVLAVFHQPDTAEVLGLAGSAILLVLLLGTAYARARRLPVPDPPTPGLRLVSLNRVYQSAVSWTGISLVLAVSYDFANLPDYSSYENVIQSVIFALQYPLAVIATTLTVIVLVVPLAAADVTAGGVIFASLFGWAVLESPSRLIVLGFALPVIPFLLAGLVYSMLIKKRNLDGQAQPAGNESLTVIRDHGPEDGSPRDRAFLAIKISLALAVLPIGYFLYVTLTTVPRTLGGFGINAVSLFATVAFEILGWIVTGLVFGMLSTRLRGLVGPLRALLLSLAWFAAAFIVDIGSGWTSALGSRAWIFQGLQLLIFLVAFGIVWDMYSLREEGDTPQAVLGKLATAYNYTRARAVIIYIIPIILAIIAIAQQIAVGSGTDFVKAVLELGQKA
jgi:hypothetical protein